MSMGPVAEVAFNKINQLSTQHEASQCTTENMPSGYKRISAGSEIFDQPDVLAHLLMLVGMEQSDPRYLYGFADSKWGRLGTETVLSYEDKTYCFSSTYTTTEAARSRFEREADTHGKPSRGIVDSLSFYKSSKVSIPALGPDTLASIEALLWDASFVTGQAGTQISFLEEKTVVKIMVVKSLNCSPNSFQCNPSYGLEEAKYVALRIRDELASE